MLRRDLNQGPLLRRTLVLSTQLWQRFNRGFLHDIMMVNIQLQQKSIFTVYASFCFSLLCIKVSLWNSYICSSSAWWLGACIVLMTALDIQVSLCNQVANLSGCPTIWLVVLQHGYLLKPSIRCWSPNVTRSVVIVSWFTRNYWRMRTNVVYFRVMRRLCHCEWNWLCVSQHPWQRTCDHGNQYSFMQASFYIIVHNVFSANFSICGSSAWWSRASMVRVTSLDIQVIRRPCWRTAWRQWKRSIVCGCLLLFM